MKFFIIFFIIGFVISYIAGSKIKDKEGKYFPNMVIVINTDSCDNKCIHLHHWFYLLILLILYFLLNYILGYKVSVNYYYLISIYIGIFIGEYYKYGNDIFIFKQKCFTNCS